MIQSAYQKCISKCNFQNVDGVSVDQQPVVYIKSAHSTAGFHCVYIIKSVIINIILNCDSQFSVI